MRPLKISFLHSLSGDATNQVGVEHIIKFENIPLVIR